MKRYIINGNDYDVTVKSVAGNRAEVIVNGVAYQVEIGDTPASKPVQAAAPVASAAPAAVPSGKSRTVNAPLPGVIVSVQVKTGDCVKAGQVVAVLEAMKMENEIQAESDGVVAAVNVKQGDSVLEGAPIVTLS